MTKIGFRLLLASTVILGVTLSTRPDLFMVSAVLIGACVLQSTAFSLVSRSRNRDNEDYQILASFFSNMLYLVVLKMLIVNGLTYWLFVPYITGSVIGSVTGAKLAEVIECRFGIESFPPTLPVGREAKELARLKKRVAILEGVFITKIKEVQHDS